MTEDMQRFLEPTRFLDSESEAVTAFSQRACGKLSSDVARAVSLYYVVRDEIRYDPYHIFLVEDGYVASSVLAQGYGFCVSKSILLAASARAQGIPSRLGYANVRNHLTTERLKRVMKTDVFVFHGYTELYLQDSWVKATPVFNLSLCERFGVRPLEFDGRHDSIFHEYDAHGNRHMEYLHDYGQFADLPFDMMVAEFRRHYPHMYKDGGVSIAGDFAAEADAERAHALSSE